MPSWGIHLTIAKKLNQKLKLNKDLFYYGNLIPDVDKNCHLSKYQAHYYNKNLPFKNCSKESMININKFLKDYKHYLNNPLILGYYSHLLTDNYYNNIVYTRSWIQDKDNNIIGIKFKNNKILSIDKDDKKHLKRYYKHRDFELYGKHLFNEIEVPKDENIIYNNLNNNKIKKLLSKELIHDRIYYLNNGFKDFNKFKFKEKLFKNNYKLFSKEELNNILNDCVKYILNEIKEKNNE